MRPEQELWAKLRSHMKKSGWDATRHEDSTTAGTPDVSWGARAVNGWLELKVIDNLPTDPKVVVPIELRPLQRVFLINRTCTGGHCAVMIYVKKLNQCFVFMKEKDFRGLGKTYTNVDMAAECYVHSYGLPEPVRFLDVLTKHYHYGEL